MNSNHAIIIDGETEVDDLALVRQIAESETAQIRRIEETRNARLKTAHPIDTFSDDSDDEPCDNGDVHATTRDDVYESHGFKGGFVDSYRLIDTVDIPERVPDGYSIAKIGICHSVVDEFAVVESNCGGNITLDLGSIVCKDDRKIIGTVADVFGKISKPYYMITINGTASLKEGDEIYYDVSHSSLVTDLNVPDYASSIENEGDSDSDETPVKTPSKLPRIKQLYADLEGSTNRPTPAPQKRGPLACIANFKQEHNKPRNT